MQIKILFCYPLLILITLLKANNPDFKPNEKPHIIIPFTSQPITIDGDLKDTGWVQAAQATNFTEYTPTEGNEPALKTKALITYDNDYIYVAFICNDNPSEVRASLTERDNMWRDDYVGIFIDTFGNASWCYYFFSNPIGVQGDEIFSSINGEDESIDFIYYSEGKITDKGYQVEMAIPFSSLRFPDKNIQEWRINFWRNMPRRDRFRYSWANVNRNDPCWLCQFGYMDGIKNIASANSMDILPYFVGSQSSEQTDPSDPKSKYKKDDPKGSYGFNFKWTATSSLTVEGALNPDFSQVESDAGQIDVNSTFALYYPEKRPFFQEGSDLFETYQDIVYTRSINNPILASKVIGRWPKATLAVLSAYDEDTPYIIPHEEFSLSAYPGKSWSNLLRYKYNFGGDNHVGLLISDRRYDIGGYDNNTGIDALYRFADNYQVEMQYTKSFTKEPSDTSLTYFKDDSVKNVRFKTKLGDTRYDPAFNGEQYNGDVSYFSVERHARNWNFDIDFRQTSPTFKTGNGFYTHNNDKRVTLWSGYNIYYNNSPVFNQIEPYINIARIWNYNGLKKDEWINPGIYMNLKGQTDMETGFILDNEHFSHKQFDAINRVYFWCDSKFSEILSLGTYLRYGSYIDRNNLVKGHGFEDLELWATFKPTTNFTFEPSWIYAELIRDDTKNFSYAGYILRCRFNYQFTREASLRLITQYNNFGNNFALEPLFSYKLNPFTIFYIGISQNQSNFGNKSIIDLYNWKTTSRQYFMKFQYLFSI